jgi:hypothetical protein
VQIGEKSSIFGGFLNTFKNLDTTWMGPEPVGFPDWSSGGGDEDVPKKQQYTANMSSTRLKFI